MGTRWYLIITEPEPWVLCESADDPWITDEAAHWTHGVSLRAEEAVMDPNYREAVLGWQRGDDTPYERFRAQDDADAAVFDGLEQLVRDGTVPPSVLKPGGNLGGAIESQGGPDAIDDCYGFAVPEESAGGGELVCRTPRKGGTRMEKRRSFRSSLFRGLGVVAALMIAAGAIAPAFSAAPLSKAKVKKIAKKQADQQITKRAPGLSVANASTLEGMPASAFASSTSEPYHEVDAPGEPAFGSGWSNEAPNETSAAFYKDPWGVVHLKGIVVRSGGGSVIFTLPPGYQPTQLPCFPTIRAAPTQEPTFICIREDGRVDKVGPGGSGTYLLDGITFRA